MKQDRNNQKFQLKVNRRQMLKIGIASGAGLILPWKFSLPNAFAAPLPAHVSLNDPAAVKKFEFQVPDAIDPSFVYSPVGMGGNMAHYQVQVGRRSGHKWGELNDDTQLFTDIYGYGDESGPTWPGRTFEVRSGRPVQVQWVNNLEPGDPHLLPVDTTLHWCYSLHGYTDYNIPDNGVPVVTHVHGHHSQARSDGNPEEFFTYRWRVTGPRFRGRTSIYDNSQPAGNLWYHDHALGITRLNVYAGMAGFYFVRDDKDTGLPGNPLSLPARPYEKAYAIQDRMFEENGRLFYPAFPGDPAYAEFITDMVGTLPVPPFDTGLSALAEFFGDHMIVNGLAWPKEDVEPRRYRLHLLNGCDSRFMVIRFRQAASLDATTLAGAGDPLTFTVIGSDQGLASSPEPTDTLVFGPGSRYDIIFDFSDYDGSRIIMENIGGDTPFGGDFGGALGPDDFFPDRQTDRIMAFDVVLSRNTDIEDLTPVGISFGPDVGTPTRTRRVALFEGMDEYGRLQPLLGTAEPATDFIGRPINWPDTAVYRDAGLIGQMNGASAWHSPTTENPAINTTEEWEIWNATGDAHPVHLHLVHFEIAGRKAIVWDSSTIEAGDLLADGSVATADDETRVIPNAKAENAAGDGTYLVEQPVVQHNGDLGSAFRFESLTTGAVVALTPADGYVENARHDMVVALPDQVTYIRARFDKPGRFVWHCHILSHEDHEMMKTLYVGPET